MPKEVVAQESAWSEDTNQLLYRGSVELTWHRDAENVQLVVRLQNSKDEEEQSLYSPSLTRYQINTLIKHLRRARDQVYGRDE